MAMTTRKELNQFLRAKFTSHNDCEVSQATITIEEFNALKNKDETNLLIDTMENLITSCKYLQECEFGSMSKDDEVCLYSALDSFNFQILTAEDVLKQIQDN